MSRFICIGIVLLLLLITGVTVFAQAPGEWRYYENDRFSLAYPNSWELSEADRIITLSYEGYTLSLLQGELRSGLPAGDFERRKLIGPYGIPVDLLIYDGRIKQVLYARLEGPGVTLSIILDGPPGQDSACEDLAIPPSVVDEASQIVSSLRLTAVQQPSDVRVAPFFSGEINPIDTWQTYSHPTEPFGFRYPLTWTLQEEAGRLVLVRDGVSFVIAYSPIGTPPPMFAPELWNKGNLEARVPIYGLHQAIPSQAIDPQADGSAAGVIYEPILTPDDQFVMWVSADTRLDTATMDEIDMVISTFKTRLRVTGYTAQLSCRRI
jgi:hypothetical protein